MARWQLSQEFEILVLWWRFLLLLWKPGHLSHLESILMGSRSTDTPSRFLGVKVMGLLDLCVLLAKDTAPHACVLSCFSHV